ncbi:Rgg/GadR/MutR family transcriptional regulator [Streptococcus acidominimus]|uniref:MutR family transcriptional regulator n=1 Tax=Streptococcus acidominimus TaxID=1326 RepID=A0A1Q8EBR8_STRAI|nr:Rgg/GadR/MutR family transcriptional regulator [Streptococcus acidominimus]MBF0846116.1 Rgg/GadR/MutR family transcriptional regulator [Streptococcus danieliae]MBF0819503.1 Rgg/GadR/MutR family transcriptional regulator [Streptococcus acidominimus]MBF0839574.1 Rgg/GadR/MutR family transcriptional regulator [Streptococcus acidominimus]OLF49233.1 MutR family transcriptional regulator [Streptococcus acidominimus]TFU29793.1 Rgg/GadR/MutR family transcriptional regulator [Streptococcus acidomini
MDYMGEIFKDLRTSRKISLKEATGGKFSYSMLSKFENGESDITISKLLIALENIHTELTEFVYLVRGFQPTAYEQLKTSIWSATAKHDPSSLLQKMHQDEIEKYERYKDESYLFNALIIKGHMCLFDDQVEMSKQELTFLYDYLFFIDIWGEFELKLFSDVACLLPLDLYFQYTREMLQKVDFLGKLRKNKNYIQTILLNGLFKSISEKKLSKAAYFDKQIKDCFFEENDSYLRIIYLFADGQHDYIKGDKEEGIKKMEKSIEILQLLNCADSADYYMNSMKNWLKNVE